jgi:hypothetical protein
MRKVPLLSGYNYDQPIGYVEIDEKVEARLIEGETYILSASLRLRSTPSNDPELAALNISPIPVYNRVKEE